MYNNCIDFLEKEKWTHTGIQFVADASGGEFSHCLLALENDMYLVTTPVFGAAKIE